ncbi:hypothetical protein POVWA2_071800 [Plasmodium ovale wallikeri]|uniref:Uncharacterized protein n=1 Tax=Plasmodium ovale wallikeri TaxID=864142 RepID=A0A1A9ADA1_PLAOA|nr:hypothetical protein POVWA1_065880 [Plasmodium ovale wallikeri]SBT56159.1 hypothetical protein POVWA2_071800 [Plasmodium ovale wallikeri]
MLFRHGSPVSPVLSELTQQRERNTPGSVTEEVLLFMGILPSSESLNYNFHHLPRFHFNCTIDIIAIFCV